MHQQQLQRGLAAGAEVDGDGIGEIGRPLVDVAANRDHGRDLRQVVDDLEIADIAGMQDRSGCE